MTTEVFSTWPSLQHSVTTVLSLTVEQEICHCCHGGLKQTRALDHEGLLPRTQKDLMSQLKL